MDEATNTQKVRGHCSKSKERKRQRNSNMKPGQIPACSSCDKKRARQKLKNVLPNAFHTSERSGLLTRIAMMESVSLLFLFNLCFAFAIRGWPDLFIEIGRAHV